MKKNYISIILIISLLLISGCGHIHSYNEDIIPPTCTEQGYTVYTCECGDIKKDSYISALGHNFDEWIITKEPTEEKTGLKERYCNVCLLKQEEEVPTKNHEHIYIESKKDATCTEDGYIKKTCECGDSFISEIIKAKHKEEVIEGKDATCTKTGLTDGKKCSVCNEILVPQEIIEPLNHEECDIPSIDATCTSYGYTKGMKCSICNLILVEPEKTEKLEHNIIIDKGKDATCTETGLTDGSHCSVCEKILISQEIIEKVEHLIVIDPEVQPTCTQMGLTEGKHCDWCKEIIEEQQKIEVISHEFDFYNNSCVYCGEKQYFEVKTELELRDADSNGKDMVIYMDYCISVEDTSIYWTLYVAPETQYIRLIGTPGVQYNFCFDIDQARIEPLRIDLYNVIIKTLTDKPIINSLSTASLTIGMYGENNQIIGKQGNNGFNGSLINFSYDGGRGSNGNIAINSNGDVTIYIKSKNTIIKGGNGGNGGTGMSAVPAPQDGGNGGAGGDGAYAIRASSVTVKFAEGYNKTNLTLTGGNGGNGGAGGSGFLWGKDGKKGNDGKTALATNITINYE